MPSSEAEALLCRILSNLRNRAPPSVEAGASPTEAELLLREIASTLRNNPTASLADGAHLEAGGQQSGTSTNPTEVVPPQSVADAIDGFVFLAVVTWIIIGIIALAKKNIQTSLITEISIAICTFAQPVLIFMIFDRVGQFFPGSGNTRFVAGLAGVAISTACTFVFTDMMKAATIFWCLSGTYIAWILVSAAQRPASWLERAPWAGTGGRVAAPFGSGYELVGREATDAEDGAGTAEPATQSKAQGQ